MALTCKFRIGLSAISGSVVRFVSLKSASAAHSILACVKLLPAAAHANV